VIGPDAYQQPRAACLAAPVLSAWSQGFSGALRQVLVQAAFLLVAVLAGLAGVLPSSCQGPEAVLSVSTGIAASEEY
jgi:hypothetical protein